MPEVEAAVGHRERVVGPVLHGRDVDLAAGQRAHGVGTGQGLLKCAIDGTHLAKVGSCATAFTNLDWMASVPSQF